VLLRKYGESSRNFRHSFLVPEVESDQTIEQKLPATNKRPMAMGTWNDPFSAAIKEDGCSG
jgi:hypothetical protein